MGRFNKGIIFELIMESTYGLNWREERRIRDEEREADEKNDNRKKDGFALKLVEDEELKERE